MNTEMSDGQNNELAADRDHTGALLEVINDQLKSIQEGQRAMASVPNDIRQLKDDMADVKADIKAIKAAIKDQTKDIGEHDLRITVLERSAA